MAAEVSRDAKRIHVCLPEEHVVLATCTAVEQTFNMSVLQFRPPNPALTVGGDSTREADAVEALQRQLKLIRGVVNMVPAMLAYWDTSQRCLFANRDYERWFGISPEELLGRTMKELLGPIYPLNLPYIEAALRGEPQEFEREIPDPHGGPPRYSQANYVPDIEGTTVRGFYVLVSDISHRKRIENELILAKKTAEDALAQVKTLKGLIPICSWCKKIRDSKGCWDVLEKYLSENTDATFSHGICEACAHKRYPHYAPDLK